MFSLRLEFLTGRYVASAFDGTGSVEWPPHPARVFSALFATHCETEGGLEQREALRWLERQPAPRIACSAASERTLKISYVPVNDKAVSDSGTAQRAWAVIYDPAATDKQRMTAEAKLSKEYAKQAVVLSKLGKDSAKAAEHVLPATRTRQPRTFRSVAPEDPVVWMTWDVAPGAVVRRALDRIAAGLVRVGHSSSLVAARWTEHEPPRATWVPGERGRHIVRWVKKGQTDLLAALYAAAPYSERRRMPCEEVRYDAPSHRVEIPESNFATDFYVLRRADGPRLPITAAEPLADAVRQALMSHCPEDPPPPLVGGHAPSGGPHHGDHVAIAALPFVGSRHATGDILGMALIPPAGLSRTELRPLHAAIAAWEHATNSPDDRPRCTLNLGGLGVWTLERAVERPAQYNLRASTWARRSRHWVSVTPVVLDRHPGSLHHGRASKRVKAVARANASIAAACERIGLPAPVEIELSTQPLLRGSEPPPRFSRRAGHEADRRPRVHVRLSFEQPVRGPILIGAGRFFGQGLFRPVEGDGR